MTRERTKRTPDGKIYHYIMSDAAASRRISKRQFIIEALEAALEK